MIDGDAEELPRTWVTDDAHLAAQYGPKNGHGVSWPRATRD
jgi:hypothetical protein